MSKLVGYRPEIDGLRAVAVLPVMLFHAGIGPFSGGYIGVDIFFVISGFLMTSIICKEIELENFLYIKFYERRARRILPALYAMVSITVIPAWLFLTPTDFLNHSKNIIGVAGFFSNITLWAQSNYFSQSADLIPLLHTWSLAVEEQYYLIIPVLLVVSYRVIRAHVFLLATILLLLSLFVCEWGAYHRPSATYYLLPTRAWELLIGTLIALTINKIAFLNLRNRLETYSNLLSMTGLLMVFLPMFTFDANTPFPSLYALVPTSGTALIIMFSGPKTVAGRFLSNKCLVGVGLVSYSAYLWHQPIYAFVRQQTILQSSTVVMYFAFALSLLIAYLSWRCIEQPFRNRQKISNNTIWRLSIAGAVMLVTFGAISIKNNGFEERFDLRPPLTKSNYDLPMRSNGWCFYSVDTDSSLPLGKDGFQCHLGEKNTAPKTLLFGDSYAAMYEPFWDLVGKRLGIGINSTTTNWCYPSQSKNFWWPNPTRAFEQCLMNREFVGASLDAYDTIIISAVWSILEEKGLMDEIYQFVFEATNFHKMKVVIMAQPHTLIRESVMRAVYKNGALEESKEDVKAQAVNDKLADIARTNNRVMFITREALFADENGKQLLLTADGVPYTWDGGHISIYGSIQAAHNFINSSHFNELKRFLVTKAD